MSGYGVFSYYYDLFTENVDYKGRTDYLYGLFVRYDRAPTLLLDFACGTGSFSEEFAKRGIDVIGVDPSVDMLGAAREKSIKNGSKTMYLCQDGRELDLYGTVDGAICCLDSLNHITDYSELCDTVSKISLFLEPERLFIFDVNTEYKHREILGNECFVNESDNVFCVWQNEYDEQSLTTSVFLDFFTEKDGVYYRESEDFCERAYTDYELRAALEGAGLKVEAVFDDMTENAPKEDSQRLIYVTRKVK